MTVSGLDHINIDTCRLTETIQFYVDVLGLESRSKPSGNSGAWLYAGDRAVVHINVIDDDRSGMSTGSVNHVAFEAHDLEALTAALVAGGYEHKVSHRPDLGVSQIFTSDPNGVAVELNVSTR